MFVETVHENGLVFVSDGLKTFVRDESGKNCPQFPKPEFFDLQFEYKGGWVEYCGKIDFVKNDSPLDAVFVRCYCQFENGRVIRFTTSRPECLGFEENPLA